MDPSRQPRDQPSRRRSPTASTKSLRHQTEIGRRRVTYLILADKLADAVMKRQRWSSVREARFCVGMGCTSSVHPSAAKARRLRLQCPPPRRRPRHRRGRDGFVHTAPGHGREDFEIWTANAAKAARARHRPDHPLHRRRRRTLHQGGAGLRRQTRHRRQGQQGRRQRRRHHCVDRGQRADRARPPQAPVSALLALQEAGHLPQHAAVVHRHGRGAARTLAGPGRQSNPARSGAQGHRRNRVRAAVGPEPAARHDRGAPGLGDLAPARLGCAHHGVPAQGDRRGDPLRQVRPVRGADGPHPHRDHREGRRCLVRKGRAGALPRRPRRQPGRLGAGDRHSRRVVRFRLHPHLHPGGPRGLPAARRHPPPARRRPRSRHVPGRLRPAPRLVPVLAAGELRHPRSRALRHGARRTASSSTRRARRRCRSPRATRSPRRT